MFSTMTPDIFVLPYRDRYKLEGRTAHARAFLEMEAPPGYRPRHGTLVVDREAVLNWIALGTWSGLLVATA